MTSRLLTAALLLLAAPASSSGPTGDCPGGGCKNRDALYRLAESPSFASGEVYENARGGSHAPSLIAGQTSPAERRPARLSAPEARATRAASVPAPAAEVQEKKEGGGILGFLSKHKWQIAGSVIGTVAGILLGGGLLGGLLGIGIGLAVSFLGPKIFSGKN